MICPVCLEEGQKITCIAGNKESTIVYHPEKGLRTVCFISRAEPEEGK